MTKFASLSQTCTFFCVFYSFVVISIEHPHQTPDLKVCSSARPEKATMLCFSHLMKMDTMPSLAALHIKYLAFVRESFWYGRSTENIMNNTKLAPTVQQKALDFRRFVAVSTGNWTQASSPCCFSSVFKKKNTKKNSSGPGMEGWECVRDPLGPFFYFFKHWYISARGFSM